VRNPHLLLSGPLSVGKTTLAEALQATGGYRLVSMRAALRAAADRPLSSRRALQQFGAEIEANTGGMWLADVLTRETATSDDSVVVDSLRTRRQFNAARVALGADAMHVHLTAKMEALARRFGERDENDIDEVGELSSALSHAIESGTDELALLADYVLDTTALDASSVVTAVLGEIGRRSSSRQEE
jgi:adenylosuccinate synthase